jgi:cupin superfamily acireductone dioxygenase involved in methionine salvage
MTAPDTHQKIPLTIRLDKGLHDKLVSAAGQKTKNEFITEILTAHLDAPQVHQERTTPAPTIAPPEILKELELKDEIIKVLEGRVKDLQNQNGFLIQDHTRISGQLDRLLMPSQEEQKEKGKKWFEFWK